MDHSRILVDSHVLVWLIKREGNIGPAARKLIDHAAVVYVSAATIWELNIKAALGKMQLSDAFESKVLDTGFVELAVSFAHAKTIREIQLPQGDPFDKLLVAQAGVEGLTFLTADTPLLSASLPFIRDVRL